MKIEDTTMDYDKWFNLLPKKNKEKIYKDSTKEIFQNWQLSFRNYILYFNPL